MDQWFYVILHNTHTLVVTSAVQYLYTLAGKKQYDGHCIQGRPATSGQHYQQVVHTIATLPCRSQAGCQTRPAVIAWDVGILHTAGAVAWSLQNSNSSRTPPEKVMLLAVATWVDLFQYGPPLLHRCVFHLQQCKQGTGDEQ
jgi:hypothetical protein